MGMGYDTSPQVYVSSWDFWKLPIASKCRNVGAFRMEWGIAALLPARAEISFDCSLSLLSQRRARLGPLYDRQSCRACRLQCRSA
jgi:hypothetical protein